LGGPGGFQFETGHARGVVSKGHLSHTHRNGKNQKMKNVKSIRIESSILRMSENEIYSRKNRGMSPQRSDRLAFLTETYIFLHHRHERMPKRAGKSKLDFSQLVENKVKRSRALRRRITTLEKY